VDPGVEARLGRGLKEVPGDVLVLGDVRSKTIEQLVSGKEADAWYTKNFPFRRTTTNVL